jgi:hypothetical protein
MSQKKMVKDILELENVKLNDISKIEFNYECTTPQFDDDIGLRMSTIYRTITVSKEHFDLLINDELTRDEESNFKSMEQYKIQDLISRVLLNIHLEWLDTNRQIKIHRVIRIYPKDTRKPTIRIEKGELDYPIDDLDIKNKKCRDMLLVIKSIKKDYPNNRILQIKDERIDCLLLYVSDMCWDVFEKLYFDEEQIETYLYELTSALDNKERVDLLGTYARFRVWYVTTYLVKLRNSVKG